MIHIDANEVLKVRNTAFHRASQLRNERHWLSEHNHQVEAMVKNAVVDELDKFRYGLEDILDRAKVKY